MKLNSANEIQKNIEIVLVSPQIEDNIGLVARVLKNTNFSNLILVNPNLTEKSFLVAKRACDILEKAKVFKDLKEALQNTNIIFGTTRRMREYEFIFDFNQIKYFLLSLASKQKVSILFGKENFGLSKKDLSLCDFVFYIPANPNFSSYNLSFAVGIVCYEIFNLKNLLFDYPCLKFASKREIENFFLFLKEKLTKKDLEKEKIESLINNFQRVIKRTLLTKKEISLFTSLVKLL